MPSSPRRRAERPRPRRFVGLRTVWTLGEHLGLLFADEELGTSVVADVDRAAKGIAKQLAAFFAEQGWTR